MKATWGFWRAKPHGVIKGKIGDKTIFQENSSKLIEKYTNNGVYPRTRQKKKNTLNTPPSDN